MESTVMTQGPKDTSVTDGESPVQPKRRGWGPVHYLALASVPLLAYQFWTLVAWLADGPVPVNQYRESGSTSWYAARIIEVGLILVALVMIAGIVRDCRKQRRLSFDAMLLIGLAASFAPEHAAAAFKIAVPKIAIAAFFRAAFTGNNQYHAPAIFLCPLKIVKKLVMGFDTSHAMKIYFAISFYLARL